MKKFALHWQILIAILLGIIVGLLFPSVTNWIEWIGALFLKALRMVVLPIIITSIISGVIRLETDSGFGKLSMKIILYYFCMSIVAVFTGLFMVNLISPGEGANWETAVSEGTHHQATDVSFYDILLGIIPSNIFESIAKGEILPVVIFSILFAIFAGKLKPEPKALFLNLFEAGFEVIMKLTRFILYFSPLGIFSIIANAMAKNSERIADIAGSLGLFMVVVLASLLIHGLITLPLVFYLIGKSNPFAHLRNMLSVLFFAFSTSSSAATLPLAIDAVVNKSGVSPKIAGFALPLGSTINMDGTALYECIAAIFIAQAYGIDLTFGQQLVVVITALLASTGAAGIPMAGMVMLTIILSSVNLPLEGIGLLLTVDRFLDMVRTTVNVWSDTCGVVVIARSEGEKTLVH
ncbi:MAG: dicarboxylate/amino acid:cation symporter [Mangrovibacterium sp.]|jgi:Na+/H+-dicarboxylate symporter